ncbi:cell division protein ZapA [Alicyclobacillus fodiniaquatilis]|uniref:Cell division protein ZapA n=1 Tax=Alicyclobacillus fodiniaquatilis TaxID=1661150 RepID=A0ABW4JKQ7_9BACL
MDDKPSVTRVKVNIHGVEYTLRGAVPAQHLQAVADMVDKMMSEIAATSSYMDERRVAVLTAINLADEFLRLREEYTDLVSLLDEQTRGDKTP